MNAQRPSTLAIPAILAVALAAPAVAHADDVSLIAAGERQQVQLATGLEYGLVAGAGYQRALPFLDRTVVVGADATLPWAGLDASDFRLRLGATVPLVGGGRWRLAGSLAPILRGNRTDLARMTDVGLDVGLVGGFYAPRWYAALESGVDLALTTHVAHSEDYRMSAHPDARDGWYANAGANLRGGLRAGVAVGRYEVSLRAGQLRDVSGDPPVIPWYGTLAAGARF